MSTKEKVNRVLADLAAAGVAASVSQSETKPSFRITRKEVPAGYGRWENGDTVMVFAGRPAAVVVECDSKDAGWASVFAPTFRDDDGEIRQRGTHSTCVVVEFSANEARAAGVEWEES